MGCETVRVTKDSRRRNDIAVGPRAKAIVDPFKRGVHSHSQRMRQPPAVLPFVTASPPESLTARQEARRRMKAYRTQGAPKRLPPHASVL